MGKWGDLARSLRASAQQTVATTDIGARAPWHKRHSAEAIGANVTIGAGGPDQLGTASPKLSAEDVAAFEERAAICEYEGRLPRASAEVLAALQCANLGADSAKFLNLAALYLEALTKTQDQSSDKP